MLHLAMIVTLLAAQPAEEPAAKFDQPDRFRQLEELLPTPTDIRTASGAPGPNYWQQRADYQIDVRIDDDTQRLTGAERITYYNNAPDTLRYLWVQIDNNQLAPGADAVLIQGPPDFDELSFRRLRQTLGRRQFDGSVSITAVTDEDGQPLPYTIVKTMMRVDLPEPLEPGDNVTFGIDWAYQINDSRLVRARTAAEYFEEDGNWIYEMAHWFPRMASYTDYGGWLNKQFLGRGEFTLEFGDYDVRITVPADHIVASTGVLQNPDDVLTNQQQARLRRAATADNPVFVVTPEEAEENEADTTDDTATWHFSAKNVRDFAWASSRKFIWDAWGHTVGDTDVLAMSYYPNEGEPLWSRYSTHAIVHTLDVYSRMTVDYPYPVCISVNGPVGGMEYPMICFNGPRPEEDGTYSARTKYGLISVIIHEVGHNWFPMIINSDERQWTWMDEGLNTFCQYVAEQEWEQDYPSRRGEPRDIISYMTSPNQVPIMTNSESILQFGANAYSKPATALNLLRETVLGRDLFDFAFKEYATRWWFKRPTPADLFRTMEDASGIDLDWFWRGWFYTNHHVDVAIDNLHHYTMDTHDPAIDKERDRAEHDAKPETLSQRRYARQGQRSDRYPDLLDFYNRYDEFEVTPQDEEAFADFLDELEDWQRELLEDRSHFYVIDFENIGGLVTPLPLRITYEDGTTKEMTIPAEIWRQDGERTSKLLVTDQPVTSILLDPYDETADANTHNNRFPRRAIESRFKAFKRERDKNPMQKAREAEDGDDENTPSEDDK